MKDDSQRRLTPQLRFPEFRKAPGWGERLLGSEADFFKGRGVSKAEIDSNGNRACIRYGELYTRYGEVIDHVLSRTSVEDSGLFLSRKNDVIIPASGETKEDIATASCIMLDDVAIGSDLNVIRTSHNGVFLSYFLNGVKRREIAKVAQGDTVVHLYPSQLEQVAIAFPDSGEQQKIADCLTSLAKLIAAHRRKLEVLRAHKRALMQQLFPLKGETRPRLRFSEFADAPGWKEKKGGELFANRTERGEPGLPLYSVTMNDGMVKRSSLDRVVEDIAEPEGNKRVRNGDIAYNMMRMWQGALGVAREDCMVSPAYVVLSPMKGVCSEFFAYLFKLPRSLQVLTSHSRGLTKDRLRLYYADFTRVALLVPEFAEQRKIADLLASLDALISVETEKLASLKNHKKGLLQQLFPSRKDSES